jgi:hypothetical protein
VRQKYLDQFFGPTAIAGHALRAFRNPLFAFTFRFWYDLVFHTANMTESLSKTHIASIRDTILSEPWLHAKIFRDTCSFFFTSIGWTTYYVWWVQHDGANGLPVKDETLSFKYVSVAALWIIFVERSSTIVKLIHRMH